jgi:DNA-directed RNA polymerase specialized sigma24 family protein
MPERSRHEAAATGLSLALFPADDRQFRDAALLAVELFTPYADGHGASPDLRPFDDERLLAAAQAMLRAAYPAAVILADAVPAIAPAAAWQVFRDTASLDGRLLRAARSGSGDALDRLSDRYQAIAFLFAWAVCGQPAAARAAVTDAMAQLLGSEQPVDGERVADTYLRLVRRSALARRTEATTGEDDAGGDGHDRLSAMLGRLPAAQAMAVSLAYGEGLSEAEVALALSIDEARTRASIREGLALLVDGP